MSQGNKEAKQKYFLILDGVHPAVKRMCKQGKNTQVYQPLVDDDEWLEKKYSIVSTHAKNPAKPETDQSIMHAYFVYLIFF